MRITKPILSEFIEFILVLIIGFGRSIYLSTNDLINQLNGFPAPVFEKTAFYYLAAEEITALPLILFFLKYRNWTLKDFNLEFKFNMFGIALILVILRLTINLVTILIINFLHLNIERASPVTSHADITGIILIIIINSIFEELLVVGYIFKRLENLHPAIIIAISFIIRESYHTYQGLGYLPFSFSLAFVFGLYYIKYKKIWPLIIAHGLGNAINFLI